MSTDTFFRFSRAEGKNMEINSNFVTENICQYMYGNVDANDDFNNS